MKAIGYSGIDELAVWARARMQRLPDFVIGGVDNPYMRRWWIVPRNELQNVYLHQILRDDDARALHDHPWANTSILLIGRYREITPMGEFIREAGSVVHRSAEDAHRLELIDGEPCVSLFFTRAKERDWGFHCSKGWVHWRDFTAGDNGEIVGLGCGE